jgi:hypothetical protein
LKRSNSQPDQTDRENPEREQGRSEHTRIKITALLFSRHYLAEYCQGNHQRDETPEKYFENAEDDQTGSTITVDGDRD